MLGSVSAFERLGWSSTDQTDLAQYVVISEGSRQTGAWSSGVPVHVSAPCRSGLIGAVCDQPARRGDFRYHEGIGTDTAIAETDKSRHCRERRCEAFRSARLGAPPRWLDTSRVSGEVKVTAQTSASTRRLQDPPRSASKPA
jgi:hypothetical protein